jgi:hypothetical protein
MLRFVRRVFLAVIACSASPAFAVPSGQSAPVTDASSLTITGTGSNVPRTAAARAADEINALDYASFQAAAGQAASAGKVLRLPPGSYSYTSSTTLTVSAPVIFEPGAVLTCSRANVAFTGLMSAPRTKIFASGCAPTLGPVADAVYPQWWGATCNGGDDTAALQNALDAGGSSSPRRVSISGNCQSSATLIVAKQVEIACGAWENGLILNSPTSGVDLLDITTGNFRMHDCALSSNYAQGSGAMLRFSGVGNEQLSHLYFWGHGTIGTGIYLENATNASMHNIWVQNATGPCVVATGTTSTTIGASGFIDSFGTIAGGSGGTDGTYYNVKLTGGSSYGAYANIVVSGGAVVSVTQMVQSGKGYLVGDVLSAPSSAIGGVTGFSVPVASIGLGSTDIQLDSHSRCDGAQGFAIGPYTDGVYITDNIFYGNSGPAVYQTAKNVWEVGGSYQIVGNDFDTSPSSSPSVSSLYFLNAWDVMITGNRIGYFTGVAGIQALNANQLVITGNKIVGGKATSCIDLGTSSGSAWATQDFTVTGNVINGCNYGVALEAGAQNGVVSDNVISGQTVASISTACNTSVVVGSNAINPNGGKRFAWNCGGQNSNEYAGVGGPRLLAAIHGADMNSTSDQKMYVSPNITAYDISKIVVTNCSTALAVPTGGFYFGAGKSQPFVAATQTYTNASVYAITNPTLTYLANQHTTQNYFYFSLTTANGSAATCDIFVYGDDLS